MPESDETANAGEQNQSEFKAPESQDELDRIIQKRLDRERSRFADYDDLKAKADKLAEIEEANKTEAEKLAQRAEAAEAKLADAERAVLRSEVAAEKNVPASLLTGSTKEELEASADALLEFRGEQKRPTPKSSAFKDIGNTPAKDTTADQFADFFNKQF